MTREVRPETLLPWWPQPPGRDVTSRYRPLLQLLILNQSTPFLKQQLFCFPFLSVSVLLPCSVLCAQNFFFVWSELQDGLSTAGSPLFRTTMKCYTPWLFLISSCLQLHSCRTKPGPLPQPAVLRASSALGKSQNLRPCPALRDSVFNTTKTTRAAPVPMAALSQEGALPAEQLQGSS